MSTFSDIAVPMSLTGTELDASVVMSLRDAAEDELLEILEANELTPDYSSATLKQVSIFWTSRNILVRQKLDGSLPNQYSVGSEKRVTNIDTVINEYNNRGWKYLNKFLRRTYSTPLIYVG